MRNSVVRRVAPALGAACLMVGALTLVPPTAAAATAPTIASAARPDSLPKDDPEDAGKDKKKRRIYTNCDQVRAEGAGPLYRGERGYNAYLDQDNDGIACNE
ncbi:excalibur calcium-binding domain-containing protein [Nocardia brasiliensis]|uniref:excalibur calcium-binding domain-containing protein n=1 Tax=Nocardia brasiliensis TaxID=37326 RepID=UPI000A88BADB|nr:excalibur calcium-binding domain-containing protein [Nocardia brasiliensis]